MSEEKSGKNSLSRRDLLKFGSLAVAGAAAAGALTACGPKSDAGGSAGSASGGATPEAITYSAGHERRGLPGFLVAPEPLKAEETKDFDVVVLGAGAAGVCAALSAAENGAKVALVQKGSEAICQGNAGAGINLEKSNPAHVSALVASIIKNNQHRATYDAVNLWAWNSGEAVQWVLDRTQPIIGNYKAQDGTPCEATDIANANNAALLGSTKWELLFVTSNFAPKPTNAGHGMMALAQVAADAGVEIFYSTEAKQLVKEGDRVIGAVGEQDGKLIQFNGSKGVIVATGDFQNDDEMMGYYLPDCRYFDRKQWGKTGDGHKMIIWAGGKMEDIGHTKMLHDFDAGPASMCDMPFLAVDYYGNRFVNEKEAGMSLLNNYLRGTSNDDAGWYVQVFDSKYYDHQDWPGMKAPTSAPEYLQTAVNPEVNSDGHIKGVFTDLIRTYNAATLEELADKLYGKQPNAADAKKNFLASVKRYNELVAKGVDEDFGKDAKWLTPIESGPFYGIYRHLRLSCGAMSGVVVDGKTHQCISVDNQPIPGLYAVGNIASGFYGGVDYPLDVFGMSLGRCYTEGYVVGRDLAKS
ncbi:MAG: FAD-dependent oxidoreductase [Coriobacteriaceae bacterium]|nr:FAD-dependent oxidoreductase [Coriobacteriaceae bacterium]